MRRSLLSYCSPYVRWLEAQQEKLEHVLEVLAGVKTIEEPVAGELNDAHPDKGARATPYGLSSEGVRTELEKRAREAYDSSMKHGAEFTAKKLWNKYQEDKSASPKQKNAASSGNSGI